MQRHGSRSSQGGEDGRQLTTKISASLIPNSLTREDPTTKYELLNELGKGSYGAVYKARDIRTSELVVIKVISLCEGLDVQYLYPHAAIDSSIGLNPTPLVELSVAIGSKDLS